MVYIKKVSMGLRLGGVGALLCLWIVAAEEIVERRPCREDNEDTIYNYNATALLYNYEVNLRQYEGKLLLVVNVATYCWYAWHYDDLTALKERYNDSLVVLAFPCNQFGLKEPGDGEEIYNAIKYVRPRFEPKVELFRKIDVNGKNEHPLYTFLKKSCNVPTKDTFAEKETLFYSPLRSYDIRWNWEKILVDHRGIPHTRFDATVRLQRIEPIIKELLSRIPTSTTQDPVQEQTQSDDYKGV